MGKMNLGGQANSDGGASVLNSALLELQTKAQELNEKMAMGKTWVTWEDLTKPNAVIVPTNGDFITVKGRGEHSAKDFPKYATPWACLYIFDATKIEFKRLIICTEDYDCKGKQGNNYVGCNSSGLLKKLVNERKEDGYPAAMLSDYGKSGIYNVMTVTPIDANNPVYNFIQTKLKEEGEVDPF